MGDGAQGLEGRLGGRDGLAFGAALLFAFCMYSSVVNLAPGLEPLRPALVTSLVAAAAAFGRRLFARERVSLDGWRGVVLLALCGLSAASVSWSVYPQGTKEYTAELFKDACIYIVMATLVTNTKRMRWVLAASVLGGLAPAWGSFQNYVNKTNLIEGTRARWEGIYLDPNHMAMAMVFLVPVGLTMVLRGRPALKVLGVVGVVGSLTAIVVSGSRGGFMGLCLAVLLWAMREKRKLRSLTLFALAAALFLVFSPQSFWNRTQTIADYQTDVSAQGRVHAWEVGHAISLDRPLLGVGGGAFVYAWPLYAPVEARNEAFVAHNVFLAMIGELGWIGFFLFLFFSAGALTACYRAGDAPEGGPWARAIFAGACGYLICDMSSGYVTSAHFFFIFGLLAAAERIRFNEMAALAEQPLVVEPGTPEAIALAEGTAG